MRTHYDNLHVSENAAPEVIRAAYKALAQRWHPDKHPNQREKAERYFKFINISYEVLSNPTARSEYDAWLMAERLVQRTSEDARPDPFAAPEQPQQKDDLHRKSQSGAGQAKNTQSPGFHASAQSTTRHPWRRFFARLIDASLISSLVICMVRLGGISSAGWILALLVASMIVIETVLISTFAKTPGKIIFGAQVNSIAHGKTPLKASFRRSFLVNLLGQGALIPGATIITYPACYFLYLKNGTTFWDRRSGTESVYSPLSEWRWALCVIAVISALILNSFLIKIATQSLSKEQIDDELQFSQMKQTPSVLPANQPSTAQPAQGDELTPEETFAKRVRAVHPDADAIVSAPRFQKWVNWSGTRRTVYSQGGADQFAQLISDYKIYISSSSQELDNFLDNIYVQFPRLNLEGANPDLEAIEMVVFARDSYIKSGDNYLSSLRRAVNEVAIKKQWIHKNANASVKTAPSYTAKQKEVKNCIIRPVMTDADYAACDIMPPRR